MNVRLYLLQRLTAAVMVPLLLVHLAIIFYATGKGLAAADILARTRGSLAWTAFYGVFVLAAAVHAGIGVFNVLGEWTPLSAKARHAAAALFTVALVVLGLRAVAAVVLP